MLGQYQVSDAARLHAKAQLRRAEAARRDQRASSQGWLRLGSFLTPRAAAGLAAILLCVLLTVGTVAASGPGDLAYGLRIAAERIPARLSPDAETRVRAELGIASRRLADLDRTMRSQDQELDERTVSALLVSVETAAETTTSLSEPVRAEVAARVAQQAELLGRFKRLAHRAQDAEALQAASGRAYRAAERAGGGPISPTPHPLEPLHEPTRGSSATPRGASDAYAHAVPRLACHRDRVARPRLQPAQAVQRRAVPRDSRRHLRRGPQPRLRGIPRRQRLWDLVRLQPPQVPDRLRLRPVPNPLQLYLVPDPTRLHPALIRPRPRPALDPLHRTQDRVRPLVIRPDRAASRDPSAQRAT